MQELIHSRVICVYNFITEFIYISVSHCSDAHVLFIQLLNDRLNSANLDFVMRRMHAIVLQHFKLLCNNITRWWNLSFLF